MDASLPVEHYRQMAAAIRRCADGMSELQLREELESLASHFERLAQYAERWQALRIGEERSSQAPH